MASPAGGARPRQRYHRSADRALEHAHDMLRTSVQAQAAAQDDAARAREETEHMRAERDAAFAHVHELEERLGAALEALETAMDRLDERTQVVAALRAVVDDMRRSMASMQRCVPSPHSIERRAVPRNTRMRQPRLVSRAAFPWRRFPPRDAATETRSAGPFCATCSGPLCILPCV